MQEYEEYEYDDLDEYEEDGEEQGEEEEADQEEYEEEEAHQPTQEELEYLELRQKLKDAIRKKMKKESGASSREVKNISPRDNYGSFFGPSQPIIAQRVIQESKSLLENPDLAARVMKSKSDNHKRPVSSTAESRPGPSNQKQKVNNVLKTKVQMLRNTRDYSFLLSDDTELPADTKVRPQKVCAPVSESRSAQVQARDKQLPSSSGRKFPNGHDVRKGPSGNEVRRGPSVQDVRHVLKGHDTMKVTTAHDGRKVPNVNDVRKIHNGHDVRRVPSGHSVRKDLNGHDVRKVSNGPDVRKSLTRGSQVQAKTGNLKMSSGSKQDCSSVDSRKQLGNYNGSGPGRPVAQKGIPSKASGNSTAKNASTSNGRSSLASVHKQSAPTSQSSSKQSLMHKRESQIISQGNTRPKQVAPSRPLAKQPTQKKFPRPFLEDERRKRKPARFDDDDDDPEVALSLIRQMFKYDPSKFRDDDDDDMEANYEDIMKEERRSAKLGRQEDDEELRKIEEEERRERQRRAKKRKLSQH